MAWFDALKDAQDASEGTIYAVDRVGQEPDPDQGVTYGPVVKFGDPEILSRKLSSPEVTMGEPQITGRTPDPEAVAADKQAGYDAVADNLDSTGVPIAKDAPGMKAQLDAYNKAVEDKDRREELAKADEAAKNKPGFFASLKDATKAALNPESIAHDVAATPGAIAKAVYPEGSPFRGGAAGVGERVGGDLRKLGQGAVDDLAFLRDYVAKPAVSFGQGIARGVNPEGSARDMVASAVDPKTGLPVTPAPATPPASTQAVAQSGIGGGSPDQGGAAANPIRRIVGDAVKGAALPGRDRDQGQPQDQGPAITTAPQKIEAAPGGTIDDAIARDVAAREAHYRPGYSRPDERKPESETYREERLLDDARNRQGAATAGKFLSFLPLIGPALSAGLQSYAGQPVEELARLQEQSDRQSQLKDQAAVRQRQDDLYNPDSKVSQLATSVYTARKLIPPGTRISAAMTSYLDQGAKLDEAQAKADTDHENMLNDRSKNVEDVRHHKADEANDRLKAQAAGSKVTPEMRQKYADAQQAVKAIDTIEKDYTDNASGWGASVAARFPSTDADQFEKRLDAQTVKLTNQLYGARASDAERETVKRLMPRAGDTDVQAKAKIEGLRNLAYEKLNAARQAQGGSELEIPETPVPGDKPRVQAQKRVTRTDPRTGETRVWDGKQWVKA